MSLADILVPVGGLGVLLLTLTQLIKDATGWTGTRVLLVSCLLGVTLGALLASGGVTELHALTAYPAWASGAVLGLLAGFGASGGKAVATNLQENGARARAEARAAVDCPTAEAEAEQWLPASIDDLGRTRTDWPEVPGLDDAPLADQPRLGRH